MTTVAAPHAPRAAHHASPGWNILSRSPIMPPPLYPLPLPSPVAHLMISSSLTRRMGAATSIMASSHGTRPPPDTATASLLERPMICRSVSNSWGMAWEPGAGGKEGISAAVCNTAPGTWPGGQRGGSRGRGGGAGHEGRITGVGLGGQGLSVKETGWHVRGLRVPSSHPHLYVLCP